MVNDMPLIGAEFIHILRRVAFRIPRRIGGNASKVFASLSEDDHANTLMRGG